MSRPRVLISWSSGKDAAWALHRLQSRGDVEIAGLLTTYTADTARIGIHGVRLALAQAQADAISLPLMAKALPWPCTNAEYEKAVRNALKVAVEDWNVMHIAFGDLYLDDIRHYRETLLAETGLTALFPLWGEPTDRLGREMIEGGLRATVVCINPAHLSPTLAGRAYDELFLDGLPMDVDPCGEGGEFHTFVWGGPMFAHPVPIQSGLVTMRDGFAVLDLEIADEEGI